MCGTFGPAFWWEKQKPRKANTRRNNSYPLGSSQIFCGVCQICTIYQRQEKTRWILKPSFLAAPRPRWWFTKLSPQKSGTWTSQTPLVVVPKRWPLHWYLLGVLYPRRPRSVGADVITGGAKEMLKLCEKKSSIFWAKVMKAPWIWIFFCKGCFFWSMVKVFAIYGPKSVDCWMDG